MKSTIAKITVAGIAAICLSLNIQAKPVTPSLADTNKMSKMKKDDKMAASKMKADNKMAADKMKADSKMSADKMKADKKMEADKMKADSKMSKMKKDTGKMSKM